MFGLLEKFCPISKWVGIFYRSTRTSTGPAILTELSNGTYSVCRIIVFTYTSQKGFLTSILRTHPGAYSEQLSGEFGIFEDALVRVSDLVDIVDLSPRGKISIKNELMSELDDR